MREPLLEVRDVAKHFVVHDGARGKRTLRAVDGVSFALAAGETLGLVGESGCGKSTLARLLVRLLEPTAGTVRFEGRDLLALRGAGLRACRRRMQIVFQDPYGSLNPRMTVGAAIGEVLRVHGLATRAQLHARVGALLERVGLDPAQSARYPHELSGGQRQRVGIARALAVEPVLLICDEPVSALDVSVQAQILNLLRDLQTDLGLACLLISHDLRVVRQMAERVAVMYLGRIVEIGPTDSLYAHPQHPYTQALLEAVPEPVPGTRRRDGARHGTAPVGRAARGCAYAPRCPWVEPACRESDPMLLPRDPGGAVACHLAPPADGAARSVPPGLPGASSEPPRDPRQDP